MDHPGSADRRPEPVPLVAVPDRDQSGARLPVPLTSFVGREREVAVVAALLRLPGVRLVTLTGPGGIGKTRLAIAAAAGLEDAFGDAPVFVALAPVTDAALVGPAVARAFGVRPSGDRPLPAHLGAVLGARRRLALLDNLEQVLDAAPVLAEILSACPGLSFLVTSREPLHLSGEQEYPVPPLRLPEVGGGADPENLGRVETVALFAQRAGAVRPDFALTVENGPGGVAVTVRLAAMRIRGGWWIVRHHTRMVRRTAAHGPVAASGRTTRVGCPERPAAEAGRVNA